MKKPRLILHIGYHKTGTTTLQRALPEVLKKNKNAQAVYLGRYYKKSDIEYARHSALIDEFAKKFGINQLSHNFVEKFYETIVNHYGDDKKIVISHENMLRPNNFDVIENQLEELKNYFEVSIIITARRVSDLIISRYRHDLAATYIKRVQNYYPHISKVFKFSNFFRFLAQMDSRILYKLTDALFDDSQCIYPYCKLNQNDGCTCFKKSGLKIINPRFYKYTELVSRLSSVLGSKNVYLVFFIEEMKHSIKSEFDEILGIPPGSLKTVVETLGRDEMNTGVDKFGKYYDSKINNASNVLVELTENTFKEEEQVINEAISSMN